MFLLQFGDDGEHALKFCMGSDGGRNAKICSALFCFFGLCFAWIDFRAGARGFAADVEDVGALFEQTLSMSDGFFAIKELATIGKRIGRDVDDSHDQRALAEFERSSTQIPLED